VIDEISDGKLLEIGYGNDTEIRRTIHKFNQGIEWWGVTPRKVSRPEARVFKGTAESLPFATNWFDVICAHQTMEHWYREAWSDKKLLMGKLKVALRSICRVLRPYGFFFCDVPIYSHGGCIFTNGDILDIHELFSQVFFKVTLQDRRRYFEPLEIVEHLTAKPPAYILTITATKGSDHAD
jgi:SAM-dependent methyltransferase